MAWRRLDWAVLVAIFALPSYLVRFTIGPAPTTLLEGMILIVFLVWLIKNNFKFLSASWRINFKPFWLVAFFLAAATVAVFVSPNLPAALGVWKAYFFEPILFFMVLKDLLEHKNENGVNLRRPSEIDTGTIYCSQIIFVLSLSALVLSAVAIYQKFTGFFIPYPWAQEAGRRVTGIFEYPNALALFLAPLAPLFIGQVLSIKYQVSSIKRLLIIGYWLLVIFVSLLAMIWARSTGALVGMAAGLIFIGAIWLLFLLRHRTKFYILHFTFYICALVVLLGLSFKILPNDFKKELLLNDWSGQVRRQMWKETITMLKDRPVLGAGLAGYQIAVAPYHKDNNIEIFLYPHNVVLSFWSETGLLGLVAFTLLVINFFYLGFKKLLTTHYSLLTISLVASMIVILIHGLVDVPYFKNDLAILFWIIYAMAI